MTTKIASFPADQNWSSNSARIIEPESIDDPHWSYCLRLEARIARQAAEIEALRQMLRSEHEQHDRALPARSTRAESQLTQFWRWPWVVLASAVARARR